MGHPERREHMNPKYMDLIPELGWHSSVKMQEVPRFIRFVLSTT